MDIFIFSLLGLAVLGVMVDIIGMDQVAGIDFVYELIVLLVIGTNIINLLKQWHLV